LARLQGWQGWRGSLVGEVGSLAAGFSLLEVTMNYMLGMGNCGARVRTVVFIIYCLSMY
jgi:hypothetical protein